MAYQYIIAAAVYTFGTILNRLTTKEPEIIRSSDELLKEEMIKRWRNIRERRELAADMASGITGKSKDYYLRNFDTREEMKVITESGQFPNFELYPSVIEKDDKIKPTPISSTDTTEFSIKDKGQPPSNILGPSSSAVGPSAKGKRKFVEFQKTSDYIDWKNSGTTDVYEEWVKGGRKTFPDSPFFEQKHVKKEDRTKIGVEEEEVINTKQPQAFRLN